MNTRDEVDTEDDTDRVESMSGEERRGLAEVTCVKADVVGPLLASPHAPRRPPALVVLH